MVRMAKSEVLSKSEPYPTPVQADLSKFFNETKTAQGAKQGNNFTARIERIKRHQGKSERGEAHDKIEAVRTIL